VVDSIAQAYGLHRLSYLSGCPVEPRKTKPNKALEPSARGVLRVTRLAAVKLSFYLYMGLRAFECQEELYAQGRTLPGKIVTNARGGDSLHNYGLAADYILDGQSQKPGVQWSWNIRADLNADGRNDWLQMAEIAVACGLVPGYFWKRLPDAPHIQNRYGLTLAEVKELYRAGHGIKAVWSELKMIS
jgi:peptidoglycan LD-endopeptidase CwlK